MKFSTSILLLGAAAISTAAGIPGDDNSIVKRSSYTIDDGTSGCTASDYTDADTIKNKPNQIWYAWAACSRGDYKLNNYNDHQAGTIIADPDDWEGSSEVGRCWIVAQGQNDDHTDGYDFRAWCGDSHTPPSGNLSASYECLSPNSGHEPKATFGGCWTEDLPTSG
ncbi:hypothetical protein N7462_004407 [Penicillium macrosclerotiorum]|uniref:uncharacterized protein n=1 Tax=Penicillium macrosclerotiorum TaxID=303699 RepID=UPI002549A4DE|nr:uncharacterized protein N7462_004407 [Penicillium macrosclerotiorum]KAJ5690015.1 hypothetical protein N7462_004407 [Penicillium macrosclerotiorum]